MKMVMVILPVLVAQAAVAGCPPPRDIAAEETALFEKMQLAETEMAGRVLSDQLWALWASAPDEAAQALLDKGMAARASYDYVAAIDAFDRLTDYCPDYAEGYNQRAFVNFLREDYEAALADLELALERRPTHVGALSGKALTLMGLGRNEEAQTVLRQAVALNPWLPERGLLQEPPGEDL